ncbi:MAG: hypothetical protein V4686_00375 [Patescibacteria group bacterium]
MNQRVYDCTIRFIRKKTPEKLLNFLMEIRDGSNAVRSTKIGSILLGVSVSLSVSAKKDTFPESYCSSVEIEHILGRIPTEFASEMLLLPHPIRTMDDLILA